MADGTIRDDLLRLATVRIDVAGRQAGTGFFIAPGTVVTCDHVIESKRLSSEAEIAITDVGGTTYPVDAVTCRSPAAEEDVAVLRVTVADHLCVLLDGAVRAGDGLHSYGYPRGHPEGVPTALEAEGETGGPAPRVKLSDGQVQPGMSGSPVLNVRTGGVCGILKRTRDERQALGGYAIPVTALFRLDPPLQRENERFHRDNRRWFELLPQEQQRLVKASWGPAPAEAAAGTLFVVTVGQEGDVWRVRATVGAGEQVGPVAVDLNPVRLEAARIFRDWPPRGRVDEGEQIRLLGSILYRALFPAEIGERFESLLGRREQERMHVSLHFEEGTDPDLVQLPWEHLYVPKRGASGAVYLASDPALGLSRTLEPAPAEEDEAPGGGPLTVLLVGVKPRQYAGEERDRFDPAVVVDAVVGDILRSAEKVGDRLRVTHLDTPDAERLATELQENEYGVVHYVGFGQFRSGADELALGAETRDGIEYVRGDVLATSLEEASPRLLVLQLCDGPRGTVQADFAILAPELLGRRIPAVVGFQYPVPADRAAKFGDALYPALAGGASVDAAVQQARKAMKLGQQTRAFVAPALFLRQPSSLRLALPSAEAVVQTPASALAHV